MSRRSLEASWSDAAQPEASPNLYPFLLPIVSCRLPGTSEDAWRGERIVLNGFIDCLAIVDAGEELATYALCGFANFGSIAIQIGGIGSLAPGRRANLAALGVRATFAGIVGLLL